MQLHVVIAPDSFKGTATAVEAAGALAAGWLEVRPGDLVRCVPMADGGEGVLDAFERARPDSVRMPVVVTGPDDRVATSSWLWLPGERSSTDAPDARSDSHAHPHPLGGTGVVELANTSGITMMAGLRPLEAHSVGFGQAVRAALDAGVDKLVLAIGSSASSDGGAGLLQALGCALLRADGTPLLTGNGALAELDRVDFSTMHRLPPGGVVVLSDVTSPLLGRSGAVAVFGAQKGVTEALAPAAEARLAHFGSVVGAARGVDPATPGAGAAGGVGFGLLAWGAELSGGAPAVAELVGLRDAIADADAVVTGEGRYDGQSEQGKVAGHVRQLAADADARAYLAVGVLAADPTGFDAAVSLTELAGDSEAARADPLTWLRAAGARLAATIEAA
ncbi:glycerate kinase [Herbiconiux sp. KACC 21604]|uniref:glycerate kinase n=1 Tax=unclassified Herbiconiux TaxID=2618217 RepID=UPI001492A8CF|nr:glycerate kinase [Herbiconiux sp. SALV-R1]QJU54662.1 glycerate kinase [Herbiconiux sp. SALV-R1]WPO85762.1 glycerate kinase [Herbiconiux sp. KACC 21604]